MLYACRSDAFSRTPTPCCPSLFSHPRSPSLHVLRHTSFSFLRKTVFSILEAENMEATLDRQARSDGQITNKKVFVCLLLLVGRRHKGEEKVFAREMTGQEFYVR